MNYNERSYKRIQDVISSIGGIYQFITVASICINKLFNNYIILSDTEILLNTSIYKAKTYNFFFLYKKLKIDRLDCIYYKEKTVFIQFIKS